MKKKYKRLNAIQFLNSALLVSVIFIGCSSARLASPPATKPDNDSNTKFTPKKSEPPSDIILNHEAQPAAQSFQETEKSLSSGAQHQPEETLRKLITEMSDKIQSLETKLSSMNDKLDAQKFNRDLLTHPSKGQETEVAEIAADNVGAPPEEAAPIPHDPEAGFTQDAAVQAFRKALIIFQGLKLPEATLAFSDFLEKYPDHPMAGAAQFYIAEAYMNQKQYKLALQEYQKLLTTYDRNSHLSDALRQMAIAEDLLKRTEEAARHRQLLTSLFPLSPAAAELELKSDKSEEPTPQPESTPVPTSGSTSKPTAPAPQSESKSPSPASTPSPLPSSSSVPKSPPTAPLEDKSGGSLFKANEPEGESFENSETETEKKPEPGKNSVK